MPCDSVQCGDSQIMSSVQPAYERQGGGAPWLGAEVERCLIPLVYQIGQKDYFYANHCKTRKLHG